VYFNTQVWSVISGSATQEQAKTAMQTVKDKLATPYGLMLSAPPFKKTSIDVMRRCCLTPESRKTPVFSTTRKAGV
jgi:hypothetical protein